MEFYGKSKDLHLLMERWCEAVIRSGKFAQQMNPDTGDFTKGDPGGYSPCALLFLHFTKRLGRAPSQRS